MKHVYTRTTYYPITGEVWKVERPQTYSSRYRVSQSWGPAERQAVAHGRVIESCHDHTQALICLTIAALDSSPYSQLRVWPRVGHIEWHQVP